MAVNSVARVWGPYKDLYNTVDSAVWKKRLEAYHDLEGALRKHKPDFLSLLQNPAKNSQQRQQIKQANTEGVVIQGQPTPRTLPTQFIQEVLILSDLFNLNEFASLELLLAAEQQQPQFPGLTRGLVAILLYYDGRRSLVNSLRTIIQSREGRTWTLGVNEETTSLVVKFTDQLMEEGLTNKVLSLVDGLDWTAEMTRLEKERGLGDQKHRKQVADLYKEVKMSLAECLFCWACQTALPKQDTLRLIRHLKKVKTVSPDGKLEAPTLALLMALLYCFDVSILEQAVDERDDIVQRLPILTDPTYIAAVHKELISMEPWGVPGLKATAQISWALTLRAISQYPEAAEYGEYLETDEQLVDLALDNNVFLYLSQAVIATDTFHTEEFYVRRLHTLVTDFLVLMPLKVKELRSHGDEEARILALAAAEGVEPPTDIRRGFEHLMTLIADLYGKDPQKLQLALEFWCPPEPSLSPSGSFLAGQHYRPPHRQVSLYKFVRIAGDLVPPSLFVPYISMLTGLANGPQCAHYCFSLLKANGGTGATVSWDHFFSSLSQYYQGLRQELASSADARHHVYRHPVRSITAQELDGLLSVLQLTERIAEEDENSRLALCEHPHWMPTVLFFGLLQCPVPSELKAALMRTVAALAKSPEIAAGLWQSLEVAQILQTVQPSGQTVQAAGIQVELEEIEARGEEYPMTLAFLHLVDRLTDIAVPPSLGAGFRAPGFDPYLEFILESVFLKFSTRAYKNPGEKWQVTSGVLQVLHKLLQYHEMSPEDFLDQTIEVQGGGTTIANKPPGHTLLIHMLNDSPLLKTILQIVDEAVRLMEQYVPFPGKEDLEKSALLCLQMLESTFDKQDQFMAVLRDQGSSVMAAPLDELLVSINPRTGRADHLVNIARFVEYNSSSPELALCSVKILCWICLSSASQSELVGMFTAQQDVSRSLLHGFVECLETDDVEDRADIAEQEDADLTASQTRCSTRQHILQLLLHSLDQPAPNLAHFLLGFELRKPVVKTNLQDPGVLGSPRTCLHSILGVLDAGVDSVGGPSCIHDNPQLSELAYKLAYHLCANTETSDPTMRYLRTTHDFLYRQMQHVPFAGKDEDLDPVLLLNQQSWLLKSVAIELRLTSLNRQRSHTQRLLSLLLDDNASQINTEKSSVTFDVDRSTFSTSMFGGLQSYGGAPTRRKILSLLDSLDFTQNYPESPQLDFMNPVVIEQVMQACHTKNKEGVSLCNVKALHKVLVAELNALQGSTAAGQRPLITEEIQLILQYAVARNQVKESLQAKKQGFGAWQQVVEVVVTACPPEMLYGEDRKGALLDILQELLRKMSDPDAVPELTSPVAGVVLTLLAHLRQSSSTEQTTLPGSQYVPLLDSQGTGYGSSPVSAGPMQVVLRGLIESIMQSGGTQQRVRANLYGALLYCLQILQAHKGAPMSSDAGSPSVLALATEGDEARVARETAGIIGSYGNSFVETVCRDASDGHDVGRMLAFSTLDSMVQLDRTQQLLTFLVNKGYLRVFVDSLVREDELLQSMLSPSPQPLRALYLYESKMALLSRLAQTPAGSQALLQEGVLVRLSECQFLDMRPENAGSVPGSGEAMAVSYEGFVPTVSDRYRQMLLPALKLCLAIMTSLGPQHRDATNQVLQFILSHMDVFHAVLREQRSGLTLPSLQELALTTGVLTQCLGEGGVFTNPSLQEDSAGAQVQSHLSRIHRQVLTLLPQYCSNQGLRKQLRSLEESVGPEGRSNKEDIRLALLQIMGNLIAYCRAVVARSGPTAQQCQLLFTPSLQEATTRDIYSAQDIHGSVTSMRPPGLGVIVQHVKQATDDFMAAFESHGQLQNKVNNVSELSNEELKELCPVGAAAEKMSTHQRQQLAHKRLTQMVCFRTQEMALCAYDVENCLFLLWRHLEYYLLHCTPADPTTAMFSLSRPQGQKLRRLQDTPGKSPFSNGLTPGDDRRDLMSLEGVSKDDIDQLKTDVISCLTEPLFRKLQDIEKNYTKSRTRYGFMEAMVRRIRRLLKLHTGV
ncbi:nuclear pore complex protein Nup205-like isoform X1 [Branchiostoma floridae x Branchiostoma japonicum]